jgi:hypothetical protein
MGASSAARARSLPGPLATEVFAEADTEHAMQLVFDIPVQRIR